MKRKVLIVEDEQRIAMLVKMLVHWENLNMECLGVCDNGESAFDMIKEFQPQIAITDIRMPKLSGLDLVRMTRESNINTYFVIVSGYKEFEYAHRALKYGVENYLLKPVNEDELNEALNKIKRKLDAQNMLTDMKEEMKKSVSESNKIIKRDFLKNIIDQKPGSYNSNMVDMKGEIYRGIDIKVDYLEFAGDNLRQEELVIDKIRDIVETIFGQETEEVLICEKENLHIYCLFNYDSSRAKKVFRLLSDILLKVKEYFMGLDQYEVTIGIGSERTEFSEIRFSILEAYCAVCNRLQFGTGRLIVYDEMTHVSEEELERKIEEIKNAMYSAIESYSRENLNIGIFRLFDSLNPENENIDMSVYFLAAEKLAELFLDHTELDKSEKEHLAAQIVRECQHCSTTSKMKKVLGKNLGECLENMRLSMESKSAKPIRIAKEYIDEHYSEKILLEDIAEIVDLNPVYFSTLFKKETDTNFSTYLTQVRMEHAKELLVSTNDTVTAIGMEVGYDDQKYFSQVFKKVIGVKPAVYRKVHS